MNYVIGNGPSIVDTFISNQFAECPLQFELTQNGQPFDDTIFTLDEEDRIIIIDTDDRTQNGQEFEFILTVTDEAGNQVQSTFDISLEDKCQTATLKEAEFFDTFAE